jgi:hypothetical protein
LGERTSVVKDEKNYGPDQGRALRKGGRGCPPGHSSCRGTRRRRSCASSASPSGSCTRRTRPRTSSSRCSAGTCRTCAVSTCGDGERARALLGVEEDLAERLVPQHLAHDHARVERDLLVLVALEGREHDLGLARDVVDRRPPAASLSTPFLRSRTRARTESRSGGGGGG